MAGGAGAIGAASGLNLISSLIDSATSLGVAGINQKTAFEVQARDFGFRRGIIREHSQALGQHGLPAFIAYGGTSHGLLDPYKVSFATGSHVGRASIVNNSFGHVPNQYGNYRRTNVTPSTFVKKK
ncbi:putative minor structural protein [Atlantic salmon calicivirus]|uniref:Putative minor structural protein n=1 Tax=Atlantic salmon calicivirus TaxID=1489836 RepID=A0A023PIU2_9CALI|nr:putative minor structural protein [Atlantic salmon calicivirus]AHX24376.1 putative minor structural protein [Atlantic salmon calicivirus]